MLATAPQTLKIAIALAALKHRPQLTSIRQYVCDLQAAFPLTCDAIATGAESNPWRRRVTELEAQLQDAEATTASQHVELLALRAAAVTPSADDASSGLPTPPSTLPPVSKKKKKGSGVGADSVLVQVSKSPADDLAHIPTSEAEIAENTISSSYLFPAIHAVQAVSSLLLRDPSARPPPSIITATACRSIEALGRLLSSVLSPQRQSTPSSLPSLPMAVSTILHVLPHTLDILIPLLLHSYKPLSNPKISNGHDWLEEDPPASSKDGQPACVPPSALPYDDLYFALDIVLIPLASLLLLPCIRAFSALTTMHLRYVLDGSCDAHASQPLTAALPASPGSYSALLARLISSTLQVLTSLCDRSRSPASNHDPALVSRVQALHDRLALACFHELLQVLLSCPPRSSTQNPKESTRTRFTRLAQKDSMHVLCMTLRICLTTPSSVCKTGTPLREALGRALADIVSIATKGALDEIEEAMLLSVVERAWEAGITMGGEGWWEDGQP